MRKTLWDSIFTRMRWTNGRSVIFKSDLCPFNIDPPHAFWQRLQLHSVSFEHLDAAVSLHSSDQAFPSPFGLKVWALTGPPKAWGHCFAKKQIFSQIAVRHGGFPTNAACSLKNKCSVSSWSRLFLLLNDRRTRTPRGFQWLGNCPSTNLIVELLGVLLVFMMF